MPAETSVVSQISGRYATALFDLAKEEGALDDVARDLERLKDMLDESADLRRVVRSPVIARSAQARAMAALMEKAGIGTLVTRFVAVVSANRRLFALVDMIRTYARLLAEYRGEVTAEVASARDLDDQQLAAIKTALANAMGREVTLRTRVDSGLIGGLVVRVGSRMVDSSLSSKLQRLRFAMKGIG